jgi:hypothetical protein
MSNPIKPNTKTSKGFKILDILCPLKHRYYHMLQRLFTKLLEGGLNSIQQLLTRGNRLSHIFLMKDNQFNVLTEYM